MADGKEFMYERYRLGELTSAERRRLEADPDFDERMAELDRSDSEILAAYPADAMAAEINRRLDTESGSRVLDFSAARRFARYVAPAAVAAAALVGILLVSPVRDGILGNPDRSPEERIKGIARPETTSVPEMVLYRSIPDGVETLKNGDSAGEYDLLQVGFTGGGAWWGTIYSVDGNGIVTRHWPVDGDDAIPLGNTSEILLPYAYELDDAPYFETFFLVWSDSSFPVDQAEELLGSYTGAETLPDPEILNPGGKTGLTAIKVLKSP